MLGNPPLDTTKWVVTIGMKEVFKILKKDGAKFILLQRQNKILKRYLSKVVGPLDPTKPKETLKTTVERRDRGAVQLDPFLNTCQQW